jgi:hypothetical protein
MRGVEECMRGVCERSVRGEFMQGVYEGECMRGVCVRSLCYDL